MNDTDKKIKVLWLYPSVLNLHGERGNMMALSRVAGIMGLTLEIVRVEAPGDVLPLDEADMLYLAPGQVKDMANIADAMKAQNEQLNAFVERGGAILATGTAGCVLARETVRADGSRFPGLGLLPMTCRERDAVYGDDIWFTTDKGFEVIGCQIQVVDTLLDTEARPYGKLIYGRGNNGGGDEGCRRKNVVFTNTLGPMLVKNPRIAEGLLCQISDIADICPAGRLAAEDTEYEDKSAELIRKFIKAKMA